MLRRLGPIAVLLAVCLAGSAPAASAQTNPAESPAAAPTARPADAAPLPPATVPRGPAAVGTLPQNLSPWGMFANADIVVQAVMVGLAFASVLTWTVWLAKSLELLAAIRSGLPARVAATAL